VDFRDRLAGLVRLTMLRPRIAELDAVASTAAAAASATAAARRAISASRRRSGCGASSDSTFDAIWAASRARHEVDRRRYALRLSPTGEQLLTRTEGAIAAAEADLLAPSIRSNASSSTASCADSPTASTSAHGRPRHLRSVTPARCDLHPPLAGRR
jgi:hypothetical protein